MLREAVATKNPFCFSELHILKIRMNNKNSQFIKVIHLFPKELLLFLIMKQEENRELKQ